MSPGQEFPIRKGGGREMLFFAKTGFL
ncbi:hypothetical protein DSUL_50391 [Desulfovibrionales bacterium]